MQCPRCQHDNAPGTKFCGECGARLAAVCPACNTANPVGQKFCGECGAPLGQAAPAATFGAPESYTPRHLAEKILTSRSALEGERKQVTVLFVDVSGFTSMSERLDPEDVHRLMTRAFELMLGEVHRYEGTVNQFLGDGIMALFGAPIAHEDHARRAVHAALGIRTALEQYHEELQRRRGISFSVRQGLNTGLVVVGSIGTDLRMDYTAVGDTTNVAARLQQAADRGRVLVAEATHRLVEGYFYTRPLGEMALKGKAEAVRSWEVISARGARTRLDVEAERGLTPYVGRERELAILAECFEKARAGHGQIVFVVGEPGIGKSRLLYEFRRRLGEEATWVEGRSISFGRSIALHPVIDMLKRNFRIEETDTEGTIVQKIERAVLRLGEDLRPILPYLKYLLSVDPGDPEIAAMNAQLRRAEIFDALRRLLVRAAEIHPQVFKHALTHEVAYNSLLVQRRKELHRLIGLAIEELYADRLSEHYEVLGYHFFRAEDWARALDYLLRAAEKATRAFALREALALYDQALEAAHRLGDAAADERTIAIHEAKAAVYVLLSDFESSYAEADRVRALASRAGNRSKEGAALASMGFASVFGHKFERALADSARAMAIAEETGATGVLASGLFNTAFVHAVTGHLDTARPEFDRVLVLSRSARDVRSQALSLQVKAMMSNWQGSYREAAEHSSDGLRAAREHQLLFPLLASLFGRAVILTGMGDYDEANAVLAEGFALSEKVGAEILHHRLLNTSGWLRAELGDLEQAVVLNQQGAEGGRKRGDHETQANAEINLAEAHLARGDLALAQEILESVHRLVEDPATSEWQKWRYSIHLFAGLGDVWLARGDLAKARRFADECLERATRTNSRRYLVRGWRLAGEIATARRAWEDAERAIRAALEIAEAIGNRPSSGRPTRHGGPCTGHEAIRSWRRARTRRPATSSKACASGCSTRSCAGRSRRRRCCGNSTEDMGGPDTAPQTPQR